MEQRLILWDITLECRESIKGTRDIEKGRVIKVRVSLRNDNNS